VSRRRDVLTFGYHIEVASLPEADNVLEELLPAEP
jgi:hypothetical protein